MVSLWGELLHWVLLYRHKPIYKIYRWWLLSAKSPQSAGKTNFYFGSRDVRDLVRSGLVSVNTARWAAGWLKLVPVVTCSCWYLSAAGYQQR